MKKLFFLLTLSAGLFFACQNSAPGDAAKTTDETQDAAQASSDATVYTVDTEASVVEWEGYKPGKYSHVGTIRLQGGELSVKAGVPESGSFVIDINSLEDKDVEDPGKRADLEGHLKSGDFFEVEKYPTGTFEMTGIRMNEADTVARYIVVGNLTLKDKTKGIEIPANIESGEGMIRVITPEFTINRTEWGINYNSGILGTVKDQIIADDVKLKINLVANSQMAEVQ